MQVTTKSRLSEPPCGRSVLSVMSCGLCMRCEVPSRRHCDDDVASESLNKERVAEQAAMKSDSHEQTATLSVSSHDRNARLSTSRVCEG